MYCVQLVVCDAVNLFHGLGAGPREESFMFESAGHCTFEEFKPVLVNWCVTTLGIHLCQERIWRLNYC